MGLLGSIVHLRGGAVALGGGGGPTGGEPAEMLGALFGSGGGEGLAGGVLAGDPRTATASEPADRIDRRIADRYWGAAGGAAPGRSNAGVGSWGPVASGFIDVAVDGIDAIAGAVDRDWRLLGGAE